MDSKELHKSLLKVYYEIKPKLDLLENQRTRLVQITKKRYEDRVNKDFKQNVKSLLKDKLTKALNLNVWISDNNEEALKHLQDCKALFLLPVMNRIIIDDYMQGEYKTVPFTIWDIKIQSYVPENHNTPLVVDILQNRDNIPTNIPLEFFALDKSSYVIITLKNNKNVESAVAIKSQAKKQQKIISLIVSIFIFLFMGFVGYILKFWLFVFFSLLPVFLSIYNIIEQRKLAIRLEDNKFSTEFMTYSDDQIESRYALTSVFIDRLTQLKTSFGGEDIRCLIVEDNIFFIIGTYKDLFEIADLNKKLNSLECLRSIYNEIISIYEIIEHFKLYEKTGL